MIEHDRRVGKRVREAGDIVQLIFEHRRVEDQSPLRKLAEPGPEMRMLENASGRPMRHVAVRRLACVLHGNLAHAAEAVGRHFERPVEQFGDRIAMPQICVADDGGADPAIAIDAACRHRADAVGELDFTEGPQHLRPVRPGKGLGLHIDGGDDVVARARVGEIILQHVAQRRPVKQMVMQNR